MGEQGIVSVIVVAAISGAVAVTGCESPRVRPRAPERNATPQPPVASAVPEPKWGAEWVIKAELEGAETIFDIIGGHCATTIRGVRCTTEDVRLGALASVHVQSPTTVWGYIFLCGVGDGGDFVCSHPSSQDASKGPPSLSAVTSVTVHAATHRDGSLSVTSNTDSMGYSEPRWAKVHAVTDAARVASSWYAGYSCFLKTNGEGACVDHDAAATATPLGNVSDGAAIWQTDQAIWVLTKTGRLLATRDRGAPLREVAESVVSFAPHTAAPGADPADPAALPPSGPEIPCAVTKAGTLQCGLARDWRLVPVQGVGRVARVFGGYDWICTTDDAGVVRCVIPARELEGTTHDDDDDDDDEIDDEIDEADLVD